MDDTETDATLGVLDGRPALRFERMLPFDVDRVWRAVSDPAELERWFPAAVAWGPTAGERLELGGMTGEVTAVEPPYLLAWTFAGDAYRFELAEQEGATRLVFVHAFDDEAVAAQAAAGWESYLSRLVPTLEGREVTEVQAHEGWEARHEHYARVFGIDPGPGRAFAAQLRGGG